MGTVRTSKLVIMLVVLALLATYTSILRYRHIEEPHLPDLDDIPLNLDDIPLNVEKYAGRNEYQEPGALAMLGADVTVFRSYRKKEGKTIWLFIGYFGSQQENSQIHSPKHCYPGSGWNIISDGEIGIRFGDRTVSVRYLTISDGRQKRIVIYWFIGGGGIITNEYSLKFHQMRSALLGKPQSTSFIRLSTIVSSGDERNALTDLVRFAEELYPHIERLKNAHDRS